MNYQEALSVYLAGDYKKVSRLIKGRGLSQLEKKLLQARLLNRSGKMHSAVKLLKTLNAEGHLEADRLFVLGTSYGLLSQREASANSFMEAHWIYRASGNERGAFVSAYNVAVDFSRLDLWQFSLQWTERATPFASTEAQKALLLRGTLCAHSRMGQWDELKISASQLAEKLPSMNFEDRISSQLILSEVLSAVDLQSARSYWDQISGTRKLKDKDRFQYLKLLVEIIDTGSSASKLEFSDPDGEYALRSTLLKHVTSGNLKTAEETWKRLRLLRPHSFGDFLELLSPDETKGFLGQALTRLKVNQQAPELTLELSPHLSKLHSVLCSSKLSLSKEDLVEKIYSVPFEISLQDRFYKLLERYRKITGNRIIKKGHAYQIVTTGIS